MRLKLFIVFFLANLTAFSQESKFPSPVGYVNDFENVFSETENSELTKIILDFEKKTTNQIAIISIDNIGTYDDFDQYCLDLSNYYGVGTKGKDNGLTIIFSTKLRKARINTGTGSQKILTDEICQKIFDEALLPEFRKGDYFNGVKTSLLKLIDKWETKK